MNLYEISEAMIDNLNIFLESEGTELDKEVHDEVMALLKKELSSKSSNLLKYLNNLQCDLEQIRLEKQRLEKIKKSKESKYEKLSDYIIYIMQTLHKAKIETEIGNYALRKSTKVEVIDEKLIPEEYFNIKVDKSVDKTTLKEVLKSKEIPGVKLTTGFNLNIQWYQKRKTVRKIWKPKWLLKSKEKDNKIKNKK